MGSMRTDLVLPKLLRLFFGVGEYNDVREERLMSPAPKRMTLQEVARQAGVSTPTISKVLNGRPAVAPATRERGLQILREQQYLPRGASALPSAHKHVELVFDALRNPNNLEILREIVKAAGEHGDHVAVSTAPENMHARG